MRTRRLILKGGGCYHCLSKTVNGALLLENREKEVFRKMLWKVAEFSGVEVLDYCILGSHFHILVRIPEAGPISDEELLRRYKILYPKPTPREQADIRVLENLLEAGGTEAEKLRNRLLKRMCDVSEFMKTLKSRFTIWFNKTHNRCGTLWSERFKSVLVEGRGNPLQTMAAYIGLNPVRAGLVTDPKDYRFCAYAEAVAGKEQALNGFQKIWGGEAWDALAQHRRALFGKGQTGKGQTVSGTAAGRVIDEEKGHLSRFTALRCRIRYFSDGVVLGSAEFVHALRFSRQSSEKRKNPPETVPLASGLHELAAGRRARKRSAQA